MLPPDHQLTTIEPDESRRRHKSTITIIVGAVVGIIGLINVAGGVAGDIEAAAPSNETAHATGTVVSAHSGSTGCVDTAMFVVNGGHYTVLSNHFRGDRCPYSMGDHVIVNYSPANPRISSN